ncbi:MAG TPA: Firmicu-CTERM sorting domain-containing protein [Clostridia bacterium]|nr:Firmicu-CTERM sorting domain-containing protein [Clostridia bacterium]
MSKKCKRAFLMLATVALLLSIVPYSFTYALDAQINMDGNLDDWKYLNGANTSSSSLSGTVKAANNEKYLYLSYQGDWSSAPNITADIYINGAKADAPYGSVTINSNANADTGNFPVLNSWGAPINDSIGIFTCQKVGYYWGYDGLILEIAVPLSEFGYLGMNIPKIDVIWSTLDNLKMTAEQINLESTRVESINNPGNATDNQNIMEEGSNLDSTDKDTQVNKEENNSKKGIVVDGYFSDWEGYNFIELDYNPNHTSKNRDDLEYVSAVWDGDYIYVYVQSLPGVEYMHSFQENIYFELSSDSEIPIPFEVYLASLGDGNSQLEVLGLSGATVAADYANDIGRWEIAIPTSSLGEYSNYIDLCWADDNTVIIKDLPNMSNEATDLPLLSGAFIMDGYYSEWNNVIHSELNFDSLNEKIINSAAIVIQKDILYVHIQAADNWLQLPTTSMQLYINGNISYDSNGHPKKDDSMLIAIANIQSDMTMGATISNVNTPQIIDGLGVFEYSQWPKRYLGEAAFTVYDSTHSHGDESEFFIDLNSVADYYGISENEIIEVTMYFPTLGQQELGIAVVSTGPYLGIAITLAVVGGYMLLRKYKKGSTK